MTIEIATNTRNAARLAEDSAARSVASAADRYIESGLDSHYRTLVGARDQWLRARVAHGEAQRIVDSLTPCQDCGAPGCVADHGIDTRAA